MHILIMPSLMYQTDYIPFAGIFQKHQANCLSGAGHRVGVISAGLLPFSAVFRPNIYQVADIADEDNVTVVRRFNKALLPQRYISPSTQTGIILKLGMEAYQTYVTRRGRPDILHVHDCLYMGQLAMKLKKEYGIPYIITEHSTMHMRDLYTTLQKRMIRDVLEQASAVTFVGSGLYRHLNKEFGDLEQVRNAEIVYNVLDKDFENFEPDILSGKPSPDDPFVFLNVAHLVEKKSQINLIKALPAVLGKVKNARLVIGGEGPMRPLLERTVSELGLSEYVSLPGRLNRRQVMQEMAKCTAFVLSSRIETFGVVLIEAMAMGKPVIATVCGGPEDFVDTGCGYLIPVEDVGTLADAMVTLAENIHNFDRVKIRRRCIDTFGKNAFTIRLEKIYHGVLHQYNP